MVGKLLHNGARICGLLLVLTATSSSLWARGWDLSVPEIDPGSIASGVTLLFGGLLLLGGKLHKKG
jgi:hypothetical protein